MHRDYESTHRLAAPGSSVESGEQTKLPPFGVAAVIESVRQSVDAATIVDTLAEQLPQTLHNVRLLFETGGSLDTQIERRNDCVADLESRIHIIEQSIEREKLQEAFAQEVAMNKRQKYQAVAASLGVLLDANGAIEEIEACTRANTLASAEYLDAADNHQMSEKRLAAHEADYVFYRQQIDAYRGQDREQANQLATIQGALARLGRLADDLMTLEGALAACNQPVLAPVSAPVQLVAMQSRRQNVGTRSSDERIARTPEDLFPGSKVAMIELLDSVIPSNPRGETNARVRDIRSVTG